MAESRLVPRNLMAWPKTRNFLPDQKLIIYHLWATCEQACGCCLLELGKFHGDLSISESALQAAIAGFEASKIVRMDQETGEIFILDWFRFHKFDNPVRKRLLAESIARIQSPRLKSIVEKSMSCLPMEVKEREGKKNTMPTRPVDNFGAWRSSEEGTLAAGQRLGVSPLPGESMGNFRQRIQETIECRR